MARTILHVDLNNFYASVECLYHPELRGKPVAVAGDVSERRGIILAKNMQAKAAGVKTGEAIWQAEAKCRGLVCVPPNYKQYLRFSRLARAIYSDYTDRLEAFGMALASPALADTYAAISNTAMSITGDIEFDDFGITFENGKQITFDAATGRLYWCDREGMRVMSCRPDGSDLTFGEMDPVEKDAISHRALAFARLKAALID